MDIVILKKIKLLPKELQDLINEFNVDHREQIRFLNTSYFKIIYNNCRICTYSFSSDIYCSTDYFIQSKYNLSCYWCCDECFNNEKEVEVRDNYIKCVKKYLLEDSIQYRFQPEIVFW